VVGVVVVVVVVVIVMVIVVVAETVAFLSYGIDGFTKGVVLQARRIMFTSRISYRISVCLSFRLSVTLRYHFKPR